MTNTTKTTEAMRFTALLNCSEACALYPDMADWFTKKLEQIEQRKLNKKPTTTQTKNEEVSAEIFSFMAENYNRLFTISELIKECPVCSEMSNQKCFSLVKSLLMAGKVENIKDKRKSLFKAII